MMSAHETPPPLGQFRPHERIGTGQCGAVYRASAGDGSAVALKIFRRAHDPALLGYFANEGLLLRAIRAHHRHPRLAEYVTSNLVRPPYFIATRLVVGGRELGTLLGRPQRPGFVAHVVMQTAEALDYLHTGHPEYSPIVHRDVKPGNILIDAAGDVVLIDLSIARHPLYALADEPGLGTVAYMAPEQHRGAAQPATDQFALALVALELLTGRRLLPSDPRRALATLRAIYARNGAQLGARLPTMPQTAETLLRALADDPAARFESCGIFASALCRALIADGYEIAERSPCVRRSLRSELNGFSMAAITAAAAALLMFALGQPALSSATDPSAATTMAERSVSPEPTPRPAAPAPSQPSAAPQREIVALANEPLRQTPSTAAQVLARMPAGTSVAPTGREQTLRGVHWYEVAYGAQIGWCRSTHCRPTAASK